MKKNILGQRAIVIGGSIAGLLSAKVLSSHYEEVVILDKDELDTYPTNRKAVPQSNHIHIVLKAGENGLNTLFPGFSEEMLSLGSVGIDMTQDMVSCSALGVSPKWDSGISLLSQSRALLEHGIYQRVVRECQNLTIKQKASVSGFRYDELNNKINGVTFKNQLTGGIETLSSDLLVDASGRAALSLRWFKDLGLSLPEVDELKVVVGYASCVVRLKDDHDRPWKGVECGGPIPNHKVAGMLMPIENGRHICSITSRFDDFPPVDEPGFFNYLSKFPHKFFGEALEGAEVVSPIQRMRYESSKFRRYDKVEGLPEGFLPIGDALCSVNPCYGQGMSSSVIQAVSLMRIMEHLAESDTPSNLANTFFANVIPSCERVWRNACLKDMRYERVEKSRDFVTGDELHHYQELEKASIFNKKLRLQLLRLNHLLDSPEILESSEFSALIKEGAPA